MNFQTNGSQKHCPIRLMGRECYLLLLISQTLYQHGISKQACVSFFCLTPAHPLHCAKVMITILERMWRITLNAQYLRDNPGTSILMRGLTTPHPIFAPLYLNQAYAYRSITANYHWEHGKVFTCLNTGETRIDANSWSALLKSCR